MRHITARKRSAVALLAVTLLAAAGFLAAAGTWAAVSPAMTGYVMDGDLQSGLAFADGTAVGSPDYPYPVVPPGTYQVTVDDTATMETFTISGIGVDESTASTGLGTVVWTIGLVPCVLYSYTGGLHFQTAASPSSTTACNKLDTQVTAS